MRCPSLSQDRVYRLLHLQEAGPADPARRRRMTDLPRAILAREIATAILPHVIAIVEEAGARLATEFSRPDGPRGADDKADIDVELELFLREALLALCPGRFVGEECGIIDVPDAPYCW